MRTILKIDEIHKLYDITDRYIRYLAKRNIEIFESAKGRLAKADPTKTIKYCGEMYEELYAFALETYTRLANTVLKHYGGQPIKDSFTIHYFSSPDPVARFIFPNEAERKRGRLEEALIVSQSKSEDLDKALREWSKAVNQLAISVTDEALIKAYKDNDIKFVQWIAVKDDKCCDECFAYDKQIFPIDKIPAKPHWNCRCRLVGVADDGRSNHAD